VHWLDEVQLQSAASACIGASAVQVAYPMSARALPLNIAFVIRFFMSSSFPRGLLVIGVPAYVKYAFRLIVSSYGVQG
jgi:hypothetical protein